MALAAKIPYDHPYAGGFPGLGGQALPTDSDCLTYLAAVKAADGAGVEVGVAVAVDAFFRGLKATPGLFDAIKASCILCGARTLSGALVPMIGAAPTNNNFVAADYTRGGATPGLVGDGSTKYLDSNRANDDDPQNDNHNAVWVAEADSQEVTAAYLDAGGVSTGANGIGRSTTPTDLFVRNRTSVVTTPADGPSTGLIGTSRSAAPSYTFRASNASSTISKSSQTPNSAEILVFARSGSSHTNARISFYSIGEALDLEALDDAVSALVTAIGAAV